MDGIQIYNASRILDQDALFKNIVHIIELALQLSLKSGFIWKTIDLGGGFGVSYFENEIDFDLGSLIQSINLVINTHHINHHETKFILELGRYLVAESGCLVGSVVAIKENHKKHFIVLDAGMHCHLGVTGIASFVHRNFPMQHIARNINAVAQKKVYQIVGPLCTPGDSLLKEITLENASINDLIVI